MYNLIDYLNDEVYTAYNRAELEEIALSLFEEEAYIWFCVLNDDYGNIFTLKNSNLYEEAYKRATDSLITSPLDIREAILILD